MFWEKAHARPVVKPVSKRKRDAAAKQSGNGPAPETAASSATDDGRLVVFYDGGCGMCTRFAEKCGERDKRNRTVWLDINTKEGRLAEYGISAEAAHARIHAVGRDGKPLHSIAALRAVWWEVPGYRFLAFLAGLPVVSEIMELAYGVLAAARSHGRR